MPLLLSPVNLLEFRETPFQILKRGHLRLTVRRNFLYNGVTILQGPAALSWRFSDTQDIRCSEAVSRRGILSLLAASFSFCLPHLEGTQKKRLSSGENITIMSEVRACRFEREGPGCSLRFE